MFTAKIQFDKHVENDHFALGCSGEARLISMYSFYLDFADTDDLIQGMANWMSERFDVNFDVAHEEIHNENQYDLFEYTQNENADGMKMNINDLTPIGYLATYSFYVEDVYQKIEYNFGGK